MGLRQPDAGQISILCQSLSQSIDLKEDIGTVFDEARFPDGINARQVDRIEALLYKKWSSETYFDYIQRFNLPETKAFKAYSRGMKMKLALAVALSHNAKILLLDEATGGLDPLEELKKFLSDGAHAILLSSHIVSDIEKLCSHVAFLHKGRLILNEKKETLLSAYPQKSLEDIILDVTKKVRD